MYSSSVSVSCIRAYCQFLFGIGAKLLKFANWELTLLFFVNDGLFLNDFG